MLYCSDSVGGTEPSFTMPVRCEGWVDTDIRTYKQKNIQADRQTDRQTPTHQCCWRSPRRDCSCHSACRCNTIPSLPILSVTCMHSRRYQRARRHWCGLQSQRCRRDPHCPLHMSIKQQHNNEVHTVVACTRVGRRY
jgi:hypothetical protein